MKIFDIIAEENITEAPMGFMKTIGNKIASKMPGSTGAAASGRLDTGKIANQLHVDLANYLGKTGQEPDAETIISFLQSKGYPTTAAQKLVPATPQASTTQTPATPTATPATPQASTTQTPATPASAPKATSYSSGAYKMPSSTGTIPSTKSPVTSTTTPTAAKPTTAAQAEVDPAKAAADKRAAAQAAATQAARAQMGASGPVAKPAEPAPVDYDVPAWQRKGMAAPDMPAIKKNSKGQYLNQNGTFMKRPINAKKESMYEAALPKAVVDKMLLAAAQEAARTGSVPAQAAQPAATSAPAAPAQSTPAAPSSGQGQPPAAQGAPSGDQGGAASAFRKGMGAGSKNTPASNATLAEKLSLQQVQEAAMALDPADQKKLLQFLSTNVA